MQAAAYAEVMDIRQITDRYFVAPQIDVDAMVPLAEAGFTTIICNRPDAEIPPNLQASEMEAAAADAGLDFHRLELTHQTFTPDRVAQQREIVDAAPGKVLAYCASGTRSCIAWALGQAGTRPTDEILAAARAGGYELDNIRPTLDAIAAQQSS